MILSIVNMPDDKFVRLSLDLVHCLQLTEILCGNCRNLRKMFQRIQYYFRALQGCFQHLEKR